MKSTNTLINKTDTKNTVPAIREEVVSSLTEAEVIEWFRRLIISERMKNKALARVDMNACYFDFCDEYNISFNAHADGNCTVSKRTAREAIDAVLRGIETPEKRAESKRIEAAKLLAEADKLEGKPPVAA